MRLILFSIIIFMLCHTVTGQVYTIGGKVALIDNKVAISIPENKYYCDFQTNEAVLFPAQEFNGPFSVNCWIYVRSWGANRALCGYSQSTDYIRLTNPSALGIKINNTLNTFIHGHTFTTSGWQMLTLVRDSNNVIRVYRNGVASSNTVVLGGTYKISQICRTSTGAWYYDGNLDEFSVFNRALGSSEVLSLYGGGSLISAGNANAFSDLRIYCKFEKNLIDSSGNGIDGVGFNIATDDFIPIY